MEANPLPTPIHLHPADAETAAVDLVSGIRSRRERAPAPRPVVVPLHGRWYLPCKHVLDFVAALALGLLALPVIAAAALVVKLTSKGPAFYTQVRVGRGGRLFTIYKIRSMVDNCESLTGPRWSMPGDPRVTWFGWLLRTTHLDELPQLLNVLRGDMSLIGPRPERPEFLPELERELPAYAQRLAVRPGVTGLAQVQLPADTDLGSVRRKLAHDLYYVRHVTPGWTCGCCSAPRSTRWACSALIALVGRLLRIPRSDMVEGAMQSVVEPAPARVRIGA